MTTTFLTLALAAFLSADPEHAAQVEPLRAEPAAADRRGGGQARRRHRPLHRGGRRQAARRRLQEGAPGFRQDRPRRHPGPDPRSEQGGGHRGQLPGRRDRQEAREDAGRHRGPRAAPVSPARTSAPASARRAIRPCCKTCASPACVRNGALAREAKAKPATPTTPARPTRRCARCRSAIWRRRRAASAGRA